ncbi:DUF4270 domain-containing protein [Tenacibaculum sp. Mcav3-52]|uniref:DUF4270 family protein n=1 Tax=Tenacibaculum sp. Mcav3-52 TaxID=2917762 RepID=UPI001EF21712|nr:DUF4270 family protein [Tenacibaculum sp. Mcav3-52]MCG7500937.1 DUF4270 domain-containing protein [Tenacibaculum sp. Mcav3-52]
MIRKIGVLGISLLCLATITSCEKDFSEVGTNVINNDKFETGEILLDVKITPIDTKNVQADNINATISDYWLGVYNNPNAEKIEASIISQLGYLSGLKNKENVTDGDTIFNLDKVILKIPYQATSKGTTNGITTFKLDSVLGNPNIATSIQVFQNETYLNTLNPSDPSKRNTFFSDSEYLGNTILNEDGVYEMKPKATDTTFIFDRIDRSSSLTNTTTYKYTVKAENSQKLKVPFLAIPLDLAKMKTLFWDKFENGEFASKEAFDNYFRGLKIMATGNDGSLVPLNLAASPTPSVDFYYTKSVVDGTTVKDTIQKEYSFPLAGVRNSIYKMTPAANPAPTNNFVIQGTAGSMAKVEILDDTKVQELKSNNWLINDASLTFYINQTINNDANVIPQQLFLYQNKKNEAGGISPTQLTDAYVDPASFGGTLKKTDDDNPEKYTFRITDYISKLLSGEENTTTDPLVLKVYNPTDAPVVNNVLTTSIKSYNWNPRAVTLLDGNETTNGTKRAVLKISYSKEK